MLLRGQLEEQGEVVPEAFGNADGGDDLVLRRKMMAGGGGGHWWQGLGGRVRPELLPRQKSIYCQEPLIMPESTQP
jgi:hypothetical protein